MSEIVKAIIVGIVQGLTEFLPVSSSGHIELANFILGNDSVTESSILMTIVLHFATALSTIIVFRKFIWDTILSIFDRNDPKGRQFALFIIISMIPAALVGFFMEDFIESLFTGNLLLVCSMLFFTAALLFVADKAKQTNKSVNGPNAFMIGIAQAIAILPGVSRSGATISTSVILGIDREEAARFSFLMVIPLIFGKIAKDVLDGSLSANTTNGLELTAGFIAAFLTGLVACKWMISIVKNSKLRYFSYYCMLVGFVGLSYYFITK